MSYDCQPGCLFNLRNDPGEVNNLYGHIEYAQMIQSMRSKLHAAGKSAPPPSSFWRDPKEGLAKICAATTATGYLEPLEV